MLELPGRWRWGLRQRGLLGTVRTELGRLRRRGRAAEAAVTPFDAEWGLETGGLIEGGELMGGHANDIFTTAYFGVPPSRMRALLRMWSETEGTGPVEGWAFADVGCGKGRALLLAAEMPFREAVGVELNAGLAAVARRNLRRWEELGRARAPLRVVEGDATEVELPQGQLLVYLYNPFRAEVLRGLLGRLAGRVKVDVLYLYPQEEAVFREFAGFEHVWRKEIQLAPEDDGVDGVSAREDPCSLYRWVG